MSLEVRGLTVVHAGRTVLHPVDLDVRTGTTLTVLGASGAGKTTLLRAIAGLEPTRGAVRWQGEDLAALPTHRRGIGLVFQEHALLPQRTVLGNVRFGLEGRGLARDEIDDRARALLERVGLAGFERRRVTTLSGGEAQRVALARALAPRPRVLLLDEPYGSLDRERRERLMVEVRDLLRGAGVTAVHVTHDHDEAFALGERVALLDGGRVVQCDAPDAVWSRPVDLRTARFLGATSALAATVRPKGRRVECALGRFDLTDPLPPGPAVVAWRPESLRVDPVGPILGRVLDHTFRRQHHVLQVSLAGTEVEAVSDAPRPRGTPVRLSFDADGALVYPA